MPFWRPEFLLLWACGLLALWALPGSPSRRTVLALLGMYFYAWWDIRFLVLPLGLSLADWALAALMARRPPGRARNALFALGVALHLGLLAFFKYSGILLQALSLAEPQAGALWIILPLGLSFQAFQAITYLASVRSGSIPARKSPLDVLAFSFFFPCLTAGPIPRAEELMPQLENLDRPRADQVFSGLARFSFGLFKKLVLADHLALYVNEVYAHPGLYSAPTVWGAVLAYALQIYLDFSGYSDMALGTAQSLGVRLPENFRFPYLSANIADFWRRWHISLSYWLRDHLYIPLGGSRRGPARTLANYMAVMLLCGAWHGSDWTFVLWGGLHGLGLCAHRLWRTRRPGALPTPLGKTLAWALTMAFVVLCWIPFRADGLGHMGQLVQAMFAGQGLAWFPPQFLLVLAATALAHWLRATGTAGRLPWQRPGWLAPATAFTLLWWSLLFQAEGFTPFIYGAF